MQEIEIKIVEFIQSFQNNFLDFFFKFVTLFGSEIFMIAIIGFVYWGIDKKAGEKIGVSIFFSLCLNNILKNFVNRLRPFEVSENIISKDGSICDELELNSTGACKATSSSFPSGHSQGASTAYNSIGLWLNKPRWYVITNIVIFFVMLSRLYLGVHFLTDVLTGYLLGLGVSIIMFKVLDKIKNKKMFYLILLGIITPFVFLSPLYAGDPGDLFKMYGGAIGCILGIFIENKYIDFKMTNVFYKRILRVVIGAGIALFFKEIPKIIFPMFAENIIFNFIRYFLITFMAVGVYPFLIKKWKFLNNKEAEVTL